MKLFYRETGRGEAVVILHGLYGCSDNWVSIARKMADRYRVISVDLRNHGNSPHSNTHTYPEMVTDLAWLFNELELERAHLMGHSMGGKVAIAFAADYPEKIISLAVVDIAPKNYLDSPASEIQYLMHKGILDALFNVDLSKFSSRNEIDQEIENEIPEPFMRGFILKNLKRVGMGFEWKLNVKVLRENLDNILHGVDLYDYNDRMPMTIYPVIFIRGGLSGYIPDEYLPEIKKMYPQAIITTIDGSTHMLHTEKPEEFAEVYLNFLKTVH
jgi:esterase